MAGFRILYRYLYDVLIQPSSNITSPTTSIIYCRKKIKLQTLLGKHVVSFIALLRPLTKTYTYQSAQCSSCMQHTASAIYVPVIPVHRLSQPSVTQKRQCSVSQGLSPRLRPLHRTQILNSPPTPCAGQTKGHQTNQSILLITRKTDSFLNSMGIYMSWWGKTYEESGHIKPCLLWFTHINTQVLHRSNFFRGYWFAVHKNLFEEIRGRQGVVFRVAQHVTCPPRYISQSLTITQRSLSF